MIDLTSFLNGSAKEEIGTAIAHAFKQSGFLYLKNHGIPQSVIDSAFETSAKFFARPQAQKDELAWTDAKSNRGYVASGREKLADLPEDVGTLRQSNPDLKENMEIGKEGVEGMPNRWPAHFDEEGEEFTAFFKQFFNMAHNLNLTVMRAIALGMGIQDESFFDAYINQTDNNLRLLHYPPVAKSVFQNGQNRVRAGEHSDYGSITLLFQDSVGGLEVKSPKGTWVRATPIQGTIVVNAGDLLSRWSNDEIKSTKHRVVQPPPSPEDLENDPNGVFPARYSIAYFCIPNAEAFIEALPGTWEDSGKKYPGVYSGQYQVQRLEETY